MSKYSEAIFAIESLGSIQKVITSERISRSSSADVTNQ